MHRKYIALYLSEDAYDFNADSFLENSIHRFPLFVYEGKATS